LIHASPRYIPHVAVVLALSAVLALLQARPGYDRETCENPAGIFPASAEPYADGDTQPERRRAVYELAAGENGRWNEGSAEVAPGLRLNYSIVRAFHPRRVYHQPGRNLATDLRTRQESIERIEDDGGVVSLHRIHFETARRAGDKQVVAAYMLIHRGETVENPVLAQVRGAPLEIVSGRRPMTRYLVFARVPPERQAEAEEATRAWLLDAWRRHQRACSGD